MTILRTFATVGFTDVARRAGRKLAAIDASPGSTVTLASVSAFHARTPDSSVRISIAVAIE